MIIRKAYRYEMDPNRGQRILCDKSAGVSRFTFNWGLDRRIKLYEEKHEYTNAIEQHHLLNSLKETEFPWMYEVSKCAPQEALRDLDKAFNNFIRGRKNGRPIGFPKFKKKGCHDSFRCTGTIIVGERHIQLPRLGKVRLKERPAVQGRILSATVTREADRWFVSILVEVDIPTPEPVQGVSKGLDLGLNHFVTLSTGEKIQAPKPLAKRLSKLKRASKQHSRKVKGSNNRKKSAKKLACIHRKIYNTRKDFLHKTSTRLVKTTPVIAVEDLNVRGLIRNRHLSRAISDVGWGEFVRMLEYKSQWYGSKLVKVPRFFPSSKHCSKCGFLQSSMPLSVRFWTCPSCRTVHDRDINAAVNIFNYGTGSSLGIYACGDTANGASQKLASCVSLKQEVMSGIIVHKL